MLFRKSQFFSQQIIFRSVSKCLKRNFKYQRPELITPCTLAMKHFDDFYRSVFKKKWPSVRLGLLLQEKNVAVINNFADVEETQNLLDNAGAFDLRSFLEIQKANINAEINNGRNNSKENMRLSDAINLKVKQTEEDELNAIYPPDKDVKFKAKFFDEDGKGNGETVDKSEFSYDPEEALTSMHSDMSNAAIDKSRLICPDSEFNDSSLYEFVPASKLRGLEEYISESEYYKYYQPKSEIPIQIEQEFEIDFPENLKVYLFDRGEISTFSQPIRCVNDIYNYLLMNGADLLTSLSLDIKFGERVLDMCKNSGTQAFCLLNTLRPKILVCNTNTNVESLFQNYLYNFSPAWKDMLLLTSFDWNKIENQNVFDKILVNVPCTNDRMSISNPKNNYFANIKLKNRLQLPQYQSSLLVAALKLVRPGGTVVYTTDTMSPIQNDGVVSKALEIAWKETNTEFCVKDLSPALKHMEFFFNFGTELGLKYGTLIVPFLPSNFGPKYFCKIVKKES